jgi:hypothetical protein
MLFDPAQLLPILDLDDLMLSCWDPVLLVIDVAC